MKKLPINKIPSALLQWADSPDDFWLGRLIRSTGYTKKEIGELAKKHKKIEHAVKLAVDSLFDKIFYNIMVGYLKPDVAEFLMMYYGLELNLVKKRDAYKYKYENSGVNNFSQWDDDKPEDEQKCKVNFYHGTEDDPFIKIENL
jgi:hypothetical protein